ncbi:hypothetical protein HNP25_002802 [Arcicella rosea]|uniref:Uncharacterized protein n=1 Tax=Arcicella rosea TaxID=502909 RepID=A0A841ERY0_9BACT|nr:hypothetical protein [Arcicella rosea]
MQSPIPSVQERIFTLRGSNSINAVAYPVSAGGNSINAVAYPVSEGANSINAVAYPVSAGENIYFTMANI